MRLGILAVALAFAALAACSDLPPYEPSCGNGVVEPHEDCDSGSGCFACSLACDAGGACPSGLACGGDLFCHAPGGQFRPQGQVLPFDGRDLFVADVDHDRVGDLVEVSSTALVTLHGQLGVGPSTETVLQTPFVTGPPAVGSFDATDGTNDVVLPTVRGLVAYTSALDVLSPYPFALDVSLPDPGKRARPWLVFPLDAGHLGLVTKLEDVDGNGTAVPGSARLAFATIDIGAGRPTFSPPQTICAGLDPDGFVDGTVRALDATHRMVAITGTTEGCVLRIDGVALQLQSELATTERLVLASIQNNPCPSVMAGVVEYKATGGFPACTVATSASAFAPLAGVLPPGDVIIGAVPLSPGISGYSSDAIATTHAIFAVSSTASAIYRSDRALDHITSMDIDGDGDLDAVAIADGQNDLDVLFRFAPTAGAAAFQLVRYDTLAHPRLTLAGDFDGNQVDDLVYSEVTTYGERLLVMYGTHDRPLPPVEMATFKSLISLLPGSTDPSDPSGTLEDLSVLDFDAATSRPLLTLMHGSPQRVLFPAFLPDLASVPSGQPPPPFTSVALGHFGGMGTVSDLFSVSQAGTEHDAWTSQAFAGAFPVVGGQPVASADCSANPGSMLCSPSLHYLAWPVDAAHDNLIALDDRHHAYTFSPASPSLGVSDDTIFSQVTDPTLVVHSLQRLDLDGDGAPELIAAFGADPTLRKQSTTGAVVACQVDASGGVVVGSCHDLGAAVSDGDGGAECVDAAVARVSAQPSLLILCHRLLAGRSDVFRVDGDHVTRVLRIASTSVERIFTGDVDGDAVDDLIALDVAPGALVPQLTIYPQCTSRATDMPCVEAP
ncbi:MAG TPA: VCBS repeat-containing protein [Kofleriaceae bacterium]|nr:VCBS repeat-containing protein [Kofleriaceae bacterium]